MAACLCSSLVAIAQDPVLNCAASGNGNGTICFSDLATFSVFLNTTCPLPDTEFVVQDPNNIVDPDGTPGTGDEGPAVLGVFSSTSFDPSMLSLTAGAEFCVTAVCYDLTQLQNIIDGIYGVSITGAPCCTFVEAQFAGLCTDLMNAGISAGADVMSLEQIFTIAGAFTGGISSLESVIGVIVTLNQNLALLNNLGCTGGETVIDYMIDGIAEADGSGTANSCCYEILSDTGPGCATCPTLTSVTPNQMEYCHGELVTICANFDGPADFITVNGNSVLTTGATQICYDVTASNMACNAATEQSNAVIVCTVDNSSNTSTITWTTNPLLTEVIVQSNCGLAGSATLTSMSGTTCAIQSLATAGVPNVCPNTNDTDADLVYDFSAFTTSCFTGSSQTSNPIDCNVACITGCTDPCSPNFDAAASIDDGSCLPQVLGCTNPSAANFDPAALCDDGSCEGVAACEPVIVTFPANCPLPKNTGSNQ